MEKPKRTGVQDVIKKVLFHDSLSKIAFQGNSLFSLLPVRAKSFKTQTIQNCKDLFQTCSGCS